jgi:hypothetical protein
MTVWLVASRTAAVTGQLVDRSITKMIYRFLLYVQGKMPMKSINHKSKSSISVYSRVCRGPLSVPVQGPFAA